MNPSVRKMTRHDKPSVMRILKATPEFLPTEVVVAEEVIDAYLNDPSGSGYEVYVAVADSIIKGYVCFGHNPMTESTWDVYWIAVSAGSQGQGIGRLLMSSAEQLIDARAGRLVVVETSAKPSYERTRRFYDGLSYEAICTIPDFYAPSDGKVIYTKRLKR